MLKFSLERGRVFIDPLSIQVRGLNQIYERDTSLGKETATKALTYIHLVAQIDPDAPYFNAPFNEVRPLVKKDLYDDYEIEFDDEEFVEDCIADYQKAYEESGARAARVVAKKIDEIIDEMDNKKIEVVRSSNRGTVTFASNFAIFQKMADSLNDMMLQQKKLEEMLKKENKADIKTRGAKRLSRQEQKLRELKAAPETARPEEAEASSSF